ncbi:hypothetical protein OAN307_c11910 [Octadecabacter antarcticus 307]|uniref:SpoIIAA-like protein n=1 Tax=Octadecabacter antarcticus 307 TaxID=391626 RepID=M9R3U0_9RHOB|nr:STAS/SEC14 domain-containing protein [Octadecabacter antarcticus]AGI66892.1 hypothetical protein OAN307_c11910 [Octadecabacter antarcticus 307]
MLLIHKTGPNRVDIELSAILDSDMMAAGLDELFEASQDISNGVMMYKIPSFSMPTGGALAAEMMRLPKLFSLIKHFSRCAVLTDIGWLQTAARIEGALIPGLEIKCFDMADEAKAEAWLARFADKEDDFGGDMPV